MHKGWKLHPVTFNVRTYSIFRTDINISFIIHAIDENRNPILLEVYSTDEDRLVLISLGLMLNKRIAGVLMDNSIGFIKVRVNDYYEKVCAIENVLKLYRFDLSKSIYSINKENLLSNLSSIVNLL